MNAKIKADFKARFGHEYLTAVPGSALEAEMREPERVTVKDLRVGDRFRLTVDGFTRDEMALVATRTGERHARSRVAGGEHDLPLAETLPVEVISRADQFASGVKAAGVVIGRALSASVPQPDGTSLVTVAFGAAAREWDYCRGCDNCLCVSSGSIVAGRLFCGGCAVEERAILAAEERAANPMIECIVPSQVSDAYAEMLRKATDDLCRSQAVPPPFVPASVHMESAPRCPGIECGSRSIRKLDSGGWFCPCGWHGESLTAPPPAARFAVGEWAFDQALGYAGRTVQILSVHASEHGPRYDVADAMRGDYDRIVERVLYGRPEKHLTPCEAPR